MFEKNLKIAFAILLVSMIGSDHRVSGKVLLHDVAPCPEMCPAVYSPVCGTNGNGFVQFGNECVLQSANCHLTRNKHKGFAETDIDWCTTQYVENLDAIVGNVDLERPECIKPCTFIYQPICVSNGTYRTTVSSQCVLDMLNCALGFTDSNSLFKVLRQGKC